MPDLAKVKPSHRHFGDDICECVCVSNHRDEAPICHHGAVPLTMWVPWPVCGPCLEALERAGFREAG